LVRFVRQTHRLLGERYSDFEIVLVTELGSVERERLDALLQELECLRVLRLSRRVGDDLALTAGLEAAIGDIVVVVMNPGHVPPAALPALIDQTRGGAHVVLGVPAGERVVESRAYRSLRLLFQHVSVWLTGGDLPPLNADMLVFSRKAVHAYTNVRQKRRHLAAILPEIGFPWIVEHYQPTATAEQAVLRPLLRSVRTGLSVLIEESTIPLRLVGVTGLLGSLLSLLYAVYVIVINLVRRDVVQGWTTLSLQISGLFFLVFVMLALLGEYMVRVLKEASDRPLYHIAEEATSSVMDRDPSRRNIFHRSADEPTDASPEGTAQRSR
jgi:dolichol-phosphate mannosyltransferase